MLLRHHLKRHLAWPKAWHALVFRQPAKPHFNFLLHLRPRKSNSEPARQPVESFNSSSHDLFFQTNRGKPKTYISACQTMYSISHRWRANWRSFLQIFPHIFISFARKSEYSNKLLSRSIRVPLAVAIQKCAMYSQATLV